jgi:3-phenylpropionate/trans-cinnamate dioxygenase ferredoxin component
MSFQQITTIDQVPAGTMKGFELNGKSVLVSNIGGRFYAIKGKCTHLGGILANGKLDGNVVTCPRHGSRFDVTTGKNLSGPAVGVFKIYSLLTIKVADEPVYPVKVEGNNLLVDVEP